LLKLKTALSKKVSLVVYEKSTCMKSKNNIRKINLLISIALIGILVMQSFWILNAIKIEEKKYNRQLTESLNNIARNFQVHQDITKIIAPEKEHLLRLKAEIETVEQELNYKEFEILKKEIIQNKEMEDMEQTIVLKIESNAPDRRTIHRSIEAPLPPGIRRSTASSDSLKDIIQDILFEFRFSEKDIQDRLERVDIDEIVEIELENKRLADDVVFYIHENEELIWSSESTQLAINEDDQGVHLFPFSELSEKAFIRYKSPSKFMAIAKRVWLMCFFSLLFTLLILYAYRKALKLYKLQLQLNEQKNDFINNMGHEFKTPIATIQLAAQTLQHEKLAEKGKDALPLSNHIIRESKRLQQYVERILSSAQLESGAFTELQLESLDLRDLIVDSIEQLKPIIDQKDVEINIEPSDKTFQYKGDRLLLTGVFRNIIENSLKYSDEKVKIDIHLKQKNQLFEISISDDGYGMNDQTKSMIFQQFYRLSTGNIHDIKGLGLGLYFAKQVIENHGGKIEVQSELNKGSTFNISLHE